MIVACSVFGRRVQEAIISCNVTGSVRRQVSKIVFIGKAVLFFDPAAVNPSLKPLDEHPVNGL